MKSIRTKIGQLHLYDFVKGAFIAAIAAPLETIMEYLDKGELPLGLDWRKILLTFIAAFLAYLLKQFLTGSTGKILVTGNNQNTIYMNYAERIESPGDIQKASGQTADVWANNPANANGIIGDDTTNLPNVNYMNRQTAPTINTWVRADLSEYTGEIVSYIGSRPNDR